MNRTFVSIFALLIFHTSGCTLGPAGDGDLASFGTTKGGGSDDPSPGDAVCGNETVEPPEQCDLGPQNHTAGPCTPDCQIARCGDGYLLEGFEECDDGNVSNLDDCVAGCKLATCGDGFVQVGVEQCDDANDDETDGCTSACTPATCGDGFVQDGEQCDDGNLVDTDKCPSTCQLAYCGDGFLEGEVEECDDGNTVETDECTNVCKHARCGDGVILAGVEECDDGNEADDDACTAACTIALCGDGVVFAGVEACDDGNLADDDGCTQECVATCVNPEGGELVAENGTSSKVMYCYSAKDSMMERARKACESHFGVDQCCVIPGGYNGQQYGQCGAHGGFGSIHWHWDSHPKGHCEPAYVVGDVISPGWCGEILGNFLD